MTPKSTVVVPLYIYPLTPATYEPLHQAIAKHQDLQFIIIINPNSGPGEPPLPDESYSIEIPKFNAQPNVTTLGYIPINYCKRDSSKVFREIETYGGWSQNDKQSGVFVEGIFFDETPNHYSEKHHEYLQEISEDVKSTNGILGRRLVMHNPGTIPDRRLASTGPDVTVVFEEGHARYRSANEAEKKALVMYDRSKASIIMHSTPANQVRQMVHELRHRAQYVFVTELRRNYYESFGQTWNEFVKAMAMD